MLQEHVDERVEATEVNLDILKGVERSDGPVDSFGLRHILLGMVESGGVPDEELISHSLRFLSHPSLQLLEHQEDGYILTTSYENAVDVIASIESLVSPAIESFES